MKTINILIPESIEELTVELDKYYESLNHLSELYKIVRSALKELFLNRLPNGVYFHFDTKDDVFYFYKNNKGTILWQIGNSFKPEENDFNCAKAFVRLQNAQRLEKLSHLIKSPEFLQQILISL